MCNDFFTDLLLVSVIGYGLFVFGCYVGEESIRQEAIKYNVATYEKTGKGKEKFTWKTQEQ